MKIATGKKSPKSQLNAFTKCSTAKKAESERTSGQNYKEVYTPSQTAESYLTFSE